MALGDGERRVDMARVSGRLFLNVAGFGFDIAVLEDIERISWLRGNALYMYSALRQLFGYRGLDIGIRSPRVDRGQASHMLLIVANARHFGGSFHIAPDASIHDGQLDAIAITNAAPLRRLALFSAAPRGPHPRPPEVIAEQASEFHLRFGKPPAYETDGEYNQARSNELEVACVPAALRLIMPAPETPRA